MKDSEITNNNSKKKYIKKVKKIPSLWLSRDLISDIINIIDTEIIFSVPEEFGQHSPQIRSSCNIVNFGKSTLE